MSQTVIGIFDDAAEAQTAMQELMEAGFSRNSIDLSIREGNAGSNSSGSRDRDEEDQGFAAGVRHFFASLFESDHDRELYATVGARHSVLTVHAQGEDEAERAADIMDEAGAIDVDERGQQYRNESYDTTAPVETSAITTGVPADPLSPVYGQTPGIVTERVNEGADMATGEEYTNRDGRMGYTTNTGEQAVDQDNDMSLNADRRPLAGGSGRFRSRIVSRQVNDQYRLRNNRFQNPAGGQHDTGGLNQTDTEGHEPISHADRGNWANTQNNPNRTVDPESDVTNR